MKQQDNQNVHSSRQSVYIHQGILPPDEHKFFSLLFPRRFVEDVRNWIMPFNVSTTKNSNFRVYVEPDNEDVAAMIESVFGKQWDYYYSLQETVSEFLRQCVQTILVYTIAPYEIVYFTPSDSDKDVSAKLVPIQPYTLKRTGKNFVQYVPRNIATQQGIPHKIVVPQDKIVVFTAPNHLKKQLPKMIEQLAYLSEYPSPDMFLCDPYSGKRPVPYSAKENLNARQIALAEATKEFGWNCGDFFCKDTLEYYQIERQLRFEHFVIEMRESLLKTLNDCIARIGQHMEFTATIIIEGLPTVKDVEFARSRLLAGEGSFEDIMAPFRRW